MNFIKQPFLLLSLFRQFLFPGHHPVQQFAKLVRKQDQFFPDIPYKEHAASKGKHAKTQHAQGSRYISGDP